MPDFHATPFNDLTETHLTSLIAAGMEESRTLDVKHDMYVAGGAGNREFLKDVSAFANTAGGDLHHWHG
jgi:hypothetical protein